MKKKIYLALLSGFLGLSSAMTVSASPRTMPDGTVFDSEYYAQTNPDVAAAWGTDKNALYQHYLTCGKAEGRKPYSDSDANAVPQI